MKKYFVAILLIIAFASCQKVITLDLKNASSQITIEGEITNAAPPYLVKISSSTGFYDDATFNGVTGATVIVTDNNNVIDTLKMITTGIYQTSKIVGTAGTTYSLKVINNGSTYTAQSIMPVPVVLDTLVYAISTGPGAGPSGGKTYDMIPVYTDPSGVQNFYRFKIIKNNKSDNTIFLENDEFNDGKKVQHALFGGGQAAVKYNDSIVFIMRCMDKKVYDYFYSLNQIVGNGPSTSATPSNPASNISNKALGYFSANTIQTKKLVIQ
jgi:hypothetical protein